MNKKVSIIITSYNRFDFLKQSVQSALDQTYENKEIIVMDDNSSDERIHEYLYDLALHGKITYWNSLIKEDRRYEHVRYSMLINLAIPNLSKGEYICYLADDDYYYPQKVEKLMKYIEDNPHAKAVFGPQDVVDVNGNICGNRFFNEVLDNGFNKLDHNQVLHHRQAFYDANGWPTDRGSWGGADAWFWQRMSDAGYKFYPVEGESLDAKRYHENAVQWKIAADVFFQ
jgi:spore maturation protein CgeD